MANKFHQGIYQPINKRKYVGKGFPIFRSSYELTMFKVCDSNPNILQWASENIQIAYKDPINNRNRVYIPDLFVIYIDKNGKRHGEIIEIKPYSQSVIEAAKSRRDRAALISNTAKWRAATIWCNKQGLVFRVMTERDIYAGGGR
jgi:hypothetical protein